MSVDHSFAAILRGEAIAWPAGVERTAENEFVDQAIRHGVATLIAHAIADRQPLGWPPSIVERFWRVEADAVALEIIRALELPRVIRRLAAEGVRPVIIKGASLAQTHYPAAHLRPSSDVDLFIDQGDLERVRMALESLDYRQTHLVTGDLIMPQVSYEQRNDSVPRQIFDIHWKLARPHALAHAVTYEELLREAAPIPVLGPEARGASDVHALLIACVHRVAHHAHEARLIWLYDIHLLAERMNARAWSHFLELTVTKRVSGVAASGLLAAQGSFATSMPHDIVARLEEQSLAVGEESRLFIDGQSNIGTLLSDLRVIDAWSDRLRLVQQHVFPSRAYMFRTYGVASKPMLPALYTRRLVTGAWRWVMQACRS